MVSEERPFCLCDTIWIPPGRRRRVITTSCKHVTMDQGFFSLSLLFSLSFFLLLSVCLSSTRCRSKRTKQSGRRGVLATAASSNTMEQKGKTLAQQASNSQSGLILQGNHRKGLNINMAAGVLQSVTFKLFSWVSPSGDDVRYCHHSPASRVVT